MARRSALGRDFEKNMFFHLSLPDLPHHPKIHVWGGDLDQPLGRASELGAGLQLHVRSLLALTADPYLCRAFAWSSHDKDELHSENGYITVYPGTTRVALTTVMNNGQFNLFILLRTDILLTH
jgi:hypothetical protein